MLKRFFGVALLAFSCALILPACSDKTATVDPTEPGGSVETTLAANQVAFHVPGMWWPTTCREAVRATLASIDGVEKVVIDFENKIATCTIAPDKFDSQVALENLQAIKGDYASTTIVNWYDGQRAKRELFPVVVHRKTRIPDSEKV